MKINLLAICDKDFPNLFGLINFIQKEEIPNIIILQTTDEVSFKAQILQNQIPRVISLRVEDQIPALKEWKPDYLAISSSGDLDDDRRKGQAIGGIWAKRMISIGNVSEKNSEEKTRIEISKSKSSTIIKWGDHNFSINSLEQELELLWACPIWRETLSQEMGVLTYLPTRFLKALTEDFSHRDERVIKAYRDLEKMMIELGDTESEDGLSTRDSIVRWLKVILQAELDFLHLYYQDQYNEDFLSAEAFLFSEDYMISIGNEKEMNLRELIDWLKDNCINLDLTLPTLPTVEKLRERLVRSTQDEEMELRYGFNPQEASMDSSPTKTPKGSCQSSKLGS